VSTDDVILTGMVQQDDSLVILGEEYTKEPYGAGIPEGDKEFKQFVDESITEFIDDGTWQETYDKWVGPVPKSPEQGPPTITLKEALKLFPFEE
jgi:ABC-type amino acid transport substrate-binding protein